MLTVIEWVACLALAFMAVFGFVQFLIWLGLVWGPVFVGIGGGIFYGVVYQGRKKP